jgi:hypothetical protein
MSASHVGPVREGRGGVKTYFICAREESREVGRKRWEDTFILISIGFSVFLSPLQLCPNFIFHYKVQDFDGKRGREWGEEEGAQQIRYIS